MIIHRVVIPKKAIKELGEELNPMSKLLGIPKGAFDFEERPIMMSLPKILWVILDNYSKTGASYEELLQEGILTYLYGDVEKLHKFLIAGATMLKEKEKEKEDLPNV